MRLGTEECNNALLTYRKVIKCNDIDNIAIDILLTADGAKIVELVDNFLNKYPEKEQNSIIQQITQKINEIYEEIGIEVSSEPTIIDNKQNIDSYRHILISYINKITDDIIQDDEQTVTIEAFCNMIQHYIKAFNTGYVDTFNEYKQIIEETNKKIDNYNKLKTHNLRIIK